MDHQCKYEKEIFEMGKTMSRIDACTNNMDKRINGSIDSFVQHINNGHKWRSAILSVSIVVILNVVVFSYVFGRLSKAVEMNCMLIKENRYGTDKRRTVRQSLSSSVIHSEETGKVGS